MKKWEYRIGYLAHRGHDSGYVPGKGFDKQLWEQDLEDTLNEFGSEGWELVLFPQDILYECVDGYALFKRPVED